MWLFLQFPVCFPHRISGIQPLTFTDCAQWSTAVRRSSVALLVSWSQGQFSHYWMYVRHRHSSPHEHWKTNRKDHFERGFTDWMKPSVAAVQYCEIQILCKWASVVWTVQGHMLHSLWGLCVPDFGAILSVSAHILTVALKKTEYHCSSLGMAQSVLINGPAVCGESALGAVEEWPQISKAKHLNTSEIPAKHRFNTTVHWELVVPVSPPLYN